MAKSCQQPVPSVPPQVASAAVTAPPLRESQQVVDGEAPTEVPSSLPQSGLNLPATATLDMLLIGLGTIGRALGKTLGL